MTEILGHDDAYDPGAGSSPRADGPGRPAEAPLVELVGHDGPDVADTDDGGELEPSRGRAVLAALTEPASLAVAAALSTLASVAVGPSYRFAAYPFNQGLTSLRNLFGTAGVGLHPLRSYLSSVAPAAALVLVGIATGVLGVLRSDEPQPAWVRAVAAGAVVVGLVLAALIALGAWQSSTFDLTVPQTVGSA